MEVADDAVKKARKLVDIFDASAAAKDMLVKTQKELPNFSSDQSPVELLPDYRPDCWWSTQEMLSRLLYLRKALEFLALNHKFSKGFEWLSKKEWDALEALHSAWEILSIAHELLCQKLPTVSLVPMLIQIVGEDLSNADVSGVAKAATQAMYKAWEERFEKNFPASLFQSLPKIVYVAHALDPRFKSLEIFDSCPDKKENVFEAILEEMLKLVLDERDPVVQSTFGDEVLEDESGVHVPPKSPQPAASAVSELRAVASKRRSGLKRGLKRLSAHLSGGSTPKKMKSLPVNDVDENVREKCREELQAFRAVDGMNIWVEQEDGSRDFADPLQWWKVHHDKFPTLWKLARAYLAIPATCSAPHRAFDAEAYAEIAKDLRGYVPSDAKLLKENFSMVEAFEDSTEVNEEEDVDTGGVGVEV